MVIQADSLSGRDDYRTANPDVHDVARSSLTVHRLVGNVPEDEPVRVADMLKIQGINIADEERTQIVVSNVDSGKLYLFGRQARLYSVSAFIIDSFDRSKAGLERVPVRDLSGKVYGGSSHLFTEWLNLYEEYFRLTRCYERGLIGRLRWRTSEYWGYVTGNARSMESTNQNTIVASFTFAHMFGEEHVQIDSVDHGSGRRSVAGDPFPAMVSKEGYEYMVSHLSSDPWDEEEANSPVSRYVEGRKRVP